MFMYINRDNISNCIYSAVCVLYIELFLFLLQELYSNIDKPSKLINYYFTHNIENGSN